ncbi:MAG: hypothetical protein MR842_05605 [Clostridiales bacterium]|nr:hypothetical protein [Clostridiales bacterium]MDY4008850.1 hypothetical protein [Candidatus Limiplasma sp.]
MLNHTTGELTFLDGSRLWAHMPAREVNERLSGAQNRDWALLPRPVAGGEITPVCQLRGGALSGVWLYASAPGARTEKQRAFLLKRLHFKDPCPDTLGCFRVACPFGEVDVSTDPYTGQAAALIRYRDEADGEGVTTF